MARNCLTYSGTEGQDYELARFTSGCVIQYRGNLDPGRARADQLRTFTIRVDGSEQHVALSPRTVVLLRNGEVIPLGSGQWPVELGPIEQ